MSDRQIKLYAETTAGGTKPVTTTINNVNPEASGDKMKDFAQMLNGFTTNTYRKTDLVETTNLDTESIKSQVTLTLNSTTSTVSGGRINIDVTTDGNLFGTAILMQGSSSNWQFFALRVDLVQLYIPSTATGTYELYIGACDLNGQKAGNALYVGSFTVS